VNIFAVASYIIDAKPIDFTTDLVEVEVNPSPKEAECLVSPPSPG
jgi:hypothetical protein